MATNRMVCLEHSSSAASSKLYVWSFLLLFPVPARPPRQKFPPASSRASSTASTTGSTCTPSAPCSRARAATRPTSRIGTERGRWEARRGTRADW